MSSLTFPSDQRLSGVHFVLFVTIANRKARPVVNANWGVHSLLDAMARLSVEWWLMIGKVSVVIEQDEHGYYAWCPELKGCQSQGTTV